MDSDLLGRTEDAFLLPIAKPNMIKKHRFPLIQAGQECTTLSRWVNNEFRGLVNLLFQAGTYRMALIHEYSFPSHIGLNTV